MTEIVPDALRPEFGRRWTAYWLSPDGSSLQATALLVLNLTIDKCNRALGHPAGTRPLVVHQGGVLPDPPQLDYAT